MNWGKPNGLKELTNMVLLTYCIFGIAITIMGGFLHSIFFILFGLIIAVIGMIFAEKIRSNHIIFLLKKNNLYSDEISSPKSDKQRIAELELKIKELLKS